MVFSAEYPIKQPDGLVCFMDLAINNDGTISREFGTKPDIEIGKYETLESILGKVAKK